MDRAGEIVTRDGQIISRGGEEFHLIPVPASKEQQCGAKVAPPALLGLVHTLLHKGPERGQASARPDHDDWYLTAGWEPEVRVL